MAHSINRLSARAVLTATKPGQFADGNNLYLFITASGAKSWSFIYRFGGKRRQMGLGPSPTVTLGAAREKATLANIQLSNGLDPLAERRRIVPSSTVATFGEVATNLIASLKTGWKNPKSPQQWHNTLTTYAAGIWDQPVETVTTEDVLVILRPIWSVIPETASRVRGRIERVLDAAKVRGLRQGANPALWPTHLSIMLPPRVKMAARNHHPAMPYMEVATFMKMLRAQPSGMAVRALEFTILTAARTSEVLEATWSEIDIKEALWIVPAARMKTGVIHRVPLSPAALALINRMTPPHCQPGDYIFPGAKPGRPLSNMSINMLLRRMATDHYTVHGFRSTFRDWVGELTDFPREVAEAALAHRVGNEVELAYSRGDALAKRQALMTAWASYLDEA